MIKARLREAREMSGMSTRQAVRFSGKRIEIDTIEALERGDRDPTESELCILAETYEVRLEWLRGEPETDSDVLAVNARGLDGLTANDVATLVRQLQAHRPA